MDTRLWFMADDVLLRQLDDWRAARRPVPSRSASVRCLIEDSLRSQQAVKNKDCPHD